MHEVIFHRLCCYIHSAILSGARQSTNIDLGAFSPGWNLSSLSRLALHEILSMSRDGFHQSNPSHFGRLTESSRFEVTFELYSPPLFVLRRSNTPRDRKTMD